MSSAARAFAGAVLLRRKDVTELRYTSLCRKVLQGTSMMAFEYDDDD